MGVVFQVAALTVCLVVINQQCRAENIDPRNSMGNGTIAERATNSRGPTRHRRQVVVAGPNPWQVPTMPTQWQPVWRTCGPTYIVDTGMSFEIPSSPPIAWMCGVTAPPRVNVGIPMQPGGIPIHGGGIPIQGPFYPGKRESAKENIEDLHMAKRISGGQQSANGQWPWAVSITKHGSHICTGSLISSRWVLTAAHCFYKDDQGQTTNYANLCEYYAIVGEAAITDLYNTGINAQKIQVDRIVRHPYYSWDATNEYDIALIRLATPVVFSDTVNPICLQDPRDFHIPGTCYAAGWGITHENQQGPTPQLLHANVGVVDANSCSIILKQPLMNRFCIANRPGLDTCSGDSGGPLVCLSANYRRWIQIGITSFGTATTGCGTQWYMPTMLFMPFPFGTPQGSPTVFSSVIAHMGWIQNIVARYGGA